MSEMTTLPTAELTNLQERVKRLANDKSYLQLIIRLMNRMSAVPGLDNSVENMLRNVVDVIGGANVILYYVVDNVIYYADVYGEKRQIDSVTDSQVESVMATHKPIEYEHEFSDTHMIAPEFSKAYTWIVPLLVGSDLVGVFKMESLHIAMRELYQQLPTFFTYAALVLKNEIQGHTRLQKAYNDLAREVEVRKQAEENLRLANEALEDRVAERTAELRAANTHLKKSQQQITALLDKSEASRRALVTMLDEERRLEATLRHERALLSRIMETSPVGITLVNRDGLVTFANPQAEKVLGLTKDSFTQRTYNSPRWRITDYHGDPFPDAELPFQRVMATRQPVYDVQHAIVWPDGRRVLLSINGAPLLNEAGEVDSVICTFEDVTEHQRAENALRESEESLRRLVEDSPVGMAVWSGLDNRVLLVNKRFKELFGYSLEDVPNIVQWWPLAYPDEKHREVIAAEWAARVERAAQSHRPIEPMTARVTCKDGSLRYIEFQSSAIGDRNLVTFIDLTERKHAEEALHRLNRELRAISNCNQILMRAVNEQALLNDICHIVCDEAGYRMAWVGYAEHDEAKTVRPVAWAGIDDGYLATANITWADTDRGRGPTGTAIRSGTSVCLQDFATDPQTILWRESALQRGYRSNVALPLKDENAQVFGALTIYSMEPNAFTPDEIRLLEELAGDLAFGITVLRERLERKQADEALRESEKKFRGFVESSSEGFTLVDEQGVIVEWNPAREKITGLPASQVIGQRLWDVQYQMVLPELQTPEFYERFKQTLLNALQTGRSPIFDRVTEVEVMHPDRPSQFIQQTIFPIKTDKGYRIGSVTSDITERKQAEQKIGRLAAIVESSEDAIISKTLEGIITSWNKGAEKIYGYTEREAVGQSIAFLVPAGQDNEVPQLLAKIRVGGRVQSHETVRRRKDGQFIHVSLSLSPIHDAAGRVIAASTIGRDITANKLAEAALQTRDKHSQSLLRLSRQLERAQTYDQVLNAARDEMRGCLGYQSLWVYLITEDKKYAYSLVAGGTAADTILSETGTSRLTIQGDRMLEEIVAAKDIVLVEDARTDERTNKDIVASMDIRTLINIPIMFFDRHLGSVGTGTFGDEGVRVPTQLEQDYLVAMASHMAVSLDRIHLLNRRAQAEEELRAAGAYARSLIEASLDPLVTISPAGKITDVNRATEQVTGVSRDQLIGDDFSNYFTEPQKAREGYQTALADGLVRDFPLTIQHISGKTTDVLYNAVVYKNQAGELQGVFAAARDITQSKQAEEEIHQLNQELEQRVLDRTAQLEAANKELEAFAYSVSHDLRSPLRHIDGFLELLQQRLAPTLDEQSRRYMQTIANAAKRMELLIDDLLSFSRMGRHDLAQQTVDLNSLVHDVIQELEPETHGRDVQWRIAELPVVTGDRAMLRVVLVNLISNALKFTRSQPHPDIEIGYEAASATELVCFIRDNGVGFDMSYADKLFGVFQRLHRAEEFEGTGIGLANVRRIIGRHGGRTWAQGAVDQGATFYFSLPQQK